jgi:deoxyribose-phosphate aldolase
MRQTQLNLERMTVRALARMIDLSLLSPNHADEDVDYACDEAIGYGFRCVTVAPYDVARASERLAGTHVAVGGTVGMPLGHSGLEAKLAEAETCLEAGADEIDMVVNLIAARSHVWGDVGREITAVRHASEGKALKIVLECCYLSDNEKIRAAEVAMDAGADFLRTSTGFGSTGATTHDVALLARTAGGAAQVKAAGGIRTLGQCMAMLRAGATRIGTSTGAAIIHDLQESQAAAARA